MVLVASFLSKVTYTYLRVILYGRNWFIFDTPRCYENLFVLYDEKIYSAHKLTESGPELTFYYFLNSTG